MSNMARKRRADPHQRSKGGTVTARKHRFESFSQRIARLKIDPVRRQTRQRAVDEDGEVADNSYTRTSLEYWKDVNMSENFVSFYREVQPLCGSLPQLLHHKDRVIDTLMRYIEKRDALSLEPFLSLITHLSHDLGARFEVYFERVVTLVSQIAAKHPDVAVIEWSFTCLAWLFKYLSKLLVPDLRPLYDLLAPLLGKTPQKPFVTSFAAQALSFLLRRAALVYERKPEPLQLFLNHALEDIGRSTREVHGNQYTEGLVLLLGETTKGVGRSLHSATQPLLKVVLSHIFSSASRNVEGNFIAEESMVEGLLISLLERTDTEGFRPALAAVLCIIESLDQTVTYQQVRLASHLLFVIIGSRFMNRIDSWPEVLAIVTKLVSLINDKKVEGDVIFPQELMAVIAVSMDHSPNNIADSYASVVRNLLDEPFVPHFLEFCIFFAEMRPDRFRGLLLHTFQQ